MRGVRAKAEQVEQQAETREEKAAAELQDALELLRVGKGTDYRGLVAAKNTRLEEVGDEPGMREAVQKGFDLIMKDAMTGFVKAVAANPFSPQALFNMGNYYQTTGEYEKAEKFFRETLELDPAHLDSLNQLAMLLQARGSDAEAEEAYEKAIEACPENVDAIFNLATLKLKQQDLKATGELVERIVEIKPELADHPLVKELRTV